MSEAHGHGHAPQVEHKIKMVGKLRLINEKVSKKLNQKKFHTPVIGHFANKSVEFKSILEASAATGIHYTMIFEACIGKIYKAKNVIWEFKKGNHYIKYKAFYINASSNYKRSVGFNG